MNPKIWGPYLWTSLLYIVLSYPESPTIDVKHDYRQFFLSLGRVLPCVECRKNYCDHLKLIPIDLYLDGQVSLLNWLWRVYNQINDFCGKSRKTMPEFLDKYLKPEDSGLVSSLSHGQVGGSFSGKNNQVLFLLLPLLLVLVWFWLK